MRKKDLEGITLKNFMKHSKYQIQTRYPVDEGFEKNLKRLSTGKTGGINSKFTPGQSNFKVS